MPTLVPPALRSRARLPLGALTDALRATGLVLPLILVVAYGVPLKGSEHQLAVAAVTLRAGRELRPKDIGGALRYVSAEQRPAIVHVVEEMPRNHMGKAQKTRLTD